MHFTKWSSGFLSLAFVAALRGCGSRSSSSTTTPPPQAQTATVSMIVSDASSEDCAGINVKAALSFHRVVALTSPCTARLVLCFR
jgi:hypothetical protein